MQTIMRLMDVLAVAEIEGKNGSFAKLTVISDESFTNPRTGTVYQSQIKRWLLTDLVTAAKLNDGKIHLVHVNRSRNKSGYENFYINGVIA